VIDVTHYLLVAFAHAWCCSS